MELAYKEAAVAARMTGAGFGGSVVVLAEADRASSLVAAVTTAYAARAGYEATGYICTSVDGARVLQSPS